MDKRPKTQGKSQKEDLHPKINMMLKNWEISYINEENEDFSEDSLDSNSPMSEDDKE